MGKSDGGWHPLKPSDAESLTMMLAQFNSRSLSGQKRMHMTLYLWSKLSDERSGTPYFKVGGRTIAKACGLTHKAVRAYLETMEEDGWIVRLEEAENGKYVKRTFSWLVENCAEQSETVPPEGHTLCPDDLQKGHTNRAPNSGGRGTHHSGTATQCTAVADTLPDGACGEAEDLKTSNENAAPKAYDGYDGYDKGPEELLRGWNPFG